MATVILLYTVNKVYRTSKDYNLVPTKQTKMLLPES